MAELAVKSASINVWELPSAIEIGKVSKKAPKKSKNTNPTDIDRVGVNNRFRTFAVFISIYNT